MLGTFYLAGGVGEAWPVSSPKDMRVTSNPESTTYKRPGVKHTTPGEQTTKIIGGVLVSRVDRGDSTSTFPQATMDLNNS